MAKRESIGKNAKRLYPRTFCVEFLLYQHTARPLKSKTSVMTELVGVALNCPFALCFLNLTLISHAAFGVHRAHRRLQTASPNHNGNGEFARALRDGNDVDALPGN